MFASLHLHGSNLSVPPLLVQVHFMTIIPYFKVTEKYDLTKASQVMRRDLRSGQASATSKLLDNQRGVALDVTFGHPFPGARTTYFT